MKLNDQEAAMSHVRVVCLLVLGAGALEAMTALAHGDSIACAVTAVAAVVAASAIAVGYRLVSLIMDS